MLTIEDLECAWARHGPKPFETHDLRELLEHVLADERRILSNQEREMTDLSGIQSDETALAAAQSQEATDVLQALADLEAKIGSGSTITQADIDALRGPIQAALGVAQSTDAAAVAADATLNPPAQPPLTS